MSLFIYSLENSFSPNVRETISYGLEYAEYEVVYLYGLSPISIIASKLCKEKEIKNFVFLPQSYRNQVLTEDIEKILLNADSSIFLPCKSSKPDLYIKENLKYLLEISSVKLCLANNHETVVKSMQCIMEAGGSYVLLPS